MDASNEWFATGAGSILLILGDRNQSFDYRYHQDLGSSFWDSQVIFNWSHFDCSISGFFSAPPLFVF